MRLLNTQTFELKEFYGKQIPKYAILSHRWEDEEVSFQDMLARRFKSMKGWRKIHGACRQALSDGREYVWVDTCCIDKSSSAELSEAINSMFAWYERASICYAFLSDVPQGLPEDQHYHKGSSFRKSLWFTRGWTLQELLAPRRLSFFDSGWKLIAFKKKLQIVLHEITGIQWSHLDFFKDASVAQKMSWLSRRETTRIEDMAYCMLGIFEIHMPPLYGEEDNAFRRLQLEILKTSDDESIFAWKADHENTTQHPYRGMLAYCPSEFSDAGDIYPYPFHQTPPYSLTNKGLQICMPLRLLTCLRREDFAGPLIYKASLNCLKSGVPRPIEIYVKQTTSREGVSRVFPQRHAHVDFYPQQNKFGDMKGDMESLTATQQEAILKSSDLIYITDILDLEESFGRHVYFNIDICGEALQQYISNIAKTVTTDGMSFWVEAAAYSFKISLHEFQPLGITFSFPGQAHFCLVLNILREKVATKLIIADQEILNDHVLLADLIQDSHSYEFTQSPIGSQDPTNWWNEESWSATINGMGDQLRLERVDRLHCKLHFVEHS